MVFSTFVLRWLLCFRFNTVVLNVGTAMKEFSCTLSPFPPPSSASSSCSTTAASSAASVVARSTFHSAELAARLPSAGAAAAPPSAAAAVKPFDRELFRAFISAASRLFCDDEQIVVIDFLAHHEKAFTERELSDRLRWGERRVREACAALERLMLIAKEHLSPSGSAAPRKAESHKENGTAFALHQQQEALGGGAGGGQQPSSGSAPSYYRVSPFCFLVFQYRLQRMEQHVEMQRRNAESRDVFFCPACRTQYDALEAQLLDVHPQDAHFLCRYCNERLEHEDSKLLLQQVTSLQERCEKQLQVLKTLVRRGWNMQIPTFPPFTRAEKNQQKLKSEEDEKHKKGVHTSQEDNLSGHSEDSFMKQQHAGDMLAEGSRSGLRAQPSWVTGQSGRRREGGMAAAEIPGAGRQGADGKCAVSVCADGGSGEWGQVLSNKGASYARQEEAAGRLQQQSKMGAATGAAGTGSGARNQIKFAMKSSGVGGKPASVLGSRLRAAHAVQQPGGAAFFPDKTRSKASPPATACALAPAEPAGRNAPAVTGPPDSGAAEISGGRKETDSIVTSRAQSGVDALDSAKQGATSVQQELQQQQEILGEDNREKEQHPLDAFPPVTAAGAAFVHREELSAAAAADIDEGPPLLYVSRLGREMTLEEAAEYQQEMTAEEHEKFMELQAMYLDEI